MAATPKKQRRSPAPKPRTTRELAFAGQTIEIPVKESATAKVLRLKVKSDGQVSLVVPLRTSDHSIDSFIREKRRWIQSTVTDALARASRLGRRLDGFVWREGSPLPVKRVQGSRSRAYLALYRDEKILAVSGPEAERAAAVERWCREELRTIAEKLIGEEAPKLGVKVKKLRIADQKTRWGSASSNGTISLNWRLLLAPHEVIDYVVIHELCHLREMNHSKRFWKLVEEARPDWREQKAWLNRHGGELHIWSPKHAL